MKNLLFVFVSFFCVNCSVFAALPDTIIVNTGQNSKVVFYGKTPAELKKLEKLDLNQLLRRINQKQDSLDQFAPQPNNPNQRIKLDVGDRTLNIKPLTAWQKYKENTFLNFYVGRSVNYEDYTITNPSQETLRNYLGYSNVSPYARASVNLENKISIGISLQHETKIVESKKIGLSLRYGLGLDISTIKYTHSATRGWTGDGSLTIDQLSNTTKRLDQYLVEQKIQPNAFGGSGKVAYLQLMPKVFLKNNVGKPVFSLAFGVRLNINDHQYDRGFSYINNSTGFSIQPTSGIVSTPDFSVLSCGCGQTSLSYIAEIGYKKITLFWHYNPNFADFSKVSYGNNTTTVIRDLIFTDKANIGYTNIGIKFGR